MPGSRVQHEHTVEVHYVNTQRANKIEHWAMQHCVTEMM